MKRLNKKGFSLLELVLYMGLFSILVLLSTDFLVTNSSFILEQSTNSSLDSDYNYITKRILYDLDRASTLITPASLGTPTTNLQLNINSTNYSYSVSGNNLTLNDSTGTYNLNSGDTTASSFSFTLLGTDSAKALRVSGTLTSNIKTDQGNKAKTLNFEHAVH